jgi:prepilin signal peptidase PulO-like enzyme (type II secretory pathway)
MIIGYLLIALLILEAMVLSGWYTTAHFRSFKSFKGKLFSRCICDHCGSIIKDIYTFPIIGFCLLKGRTHCCSKFIPIKYLIWEIILTAIHIIAMSLLRNHPAYCAILLFALFLIFMIIVWIVNRPQKINPQNTIKIMILSIPVYASVWFILHMYNGFLVKLYA